MFRFKGKTSHFKHEKKKNMSAMVKNSKKKEGRKGGRGKGWEEGGKMKVADY